MRPTFVKWFFVYWIWRTKMWKQFCKLSWGAKVGLGLTPQLLRVKLTLNQRKGQKKFVKPQKNWHEVHEAYNCRNNNKKASFSEKNAQCENLRIYLTFIFYVKTLKESYFLWNLSFNFDEMADRSSPNVGANFVIN